jgi:hypothetical protein
MGWYSCASTYSNAFATFLTTFNGENDGRTWTPLYDSDTGVGTFSTPNFLLTATSASTIGGFGAFSTSPSSPTTTIGGSNDGSSITIGKKKSSIGAIVGGVIGGLVVLALVVFAVVFVCIKSRQPKNNAATTNTGAQAAPMAPMAAAAVPPMQQQQNGYAQNGYGQNGYAQDPRMSYFEASKDGLKAPNEYVQSIPPSPAPMYTPQSPPPPTMSPPMPIGSPPPHMLGQQMQMSSQPQGPPPGVYEAGGMPIQPSPSISVASPVSAASPAMQPAYPHAQQGPPPGVYEAGGMPVQSSPQPNVILPMSTGTPAMQHPYPQAPQEQQAPVELGTNFVVPTHNQQGTPVFEIQ